MKPVVFGIFMTLLAGAGLFWLWDSQQSTPSHNESVVAQQIAPPTPEKQLNPVIRELPPTSALPPAAEETTASTPPAQTLPQLVTAPTDLGQSDTQTREAIRELPQRQAVANQLLQWLTPREQIRKWVLLVDNVAMGKVPTKNRPLEFALTPFAVTGGETDPVLAESNFNRLDPLVDAFVTLDPELMARYYQAWESLLQEAYGELGQPGPFRTRLLEAMDRVLAVEPWAQMPIALKRPSVYFRFADPEREAASELEKLLWRMGPRNTIRIQSQLRDIKLALQALAP